MVPVFEARIGTCSVCTARGEEPVETSVIRSKHDGLAAFDRDTGETKMILQSRDWVCEDCEEWLDRRFLN